jgi:spore germination cell wall hydrolase CwlJ-like protein
MNLKEAGALNLLTATIWGEARGEPILGKIAVGWVIRNRVEDLKRWPDTYEDVILQPKQFSCWNENDPNYESCVRALFPSRNGNSMNMTWRECRLAAHAVLYNWHHDPTYGSNHYHAVLIKRIPYWAKDQLCIRVIFGHQFYKL